MLLLTYDLNTWVLITSEETHTLVLGMATKRYSTSFFLALFFYSASCSIKDITTPLTTVPTINIPTATKPPIINPSTLPDNTRSYVPFAVPTPSSPSIPGGSWCIASQTAGEIALQNALDYACGKGGAKCSAIQVAGGCYEPNTLVDHASYAFNDYYQKNPVPNSCNFGGTGVVTSTNPSTQACTYPSTSTSSSVLDTTNQNVSTVFGVGGPPGPPISSATPLLNKVPCLFETMCFIFLLLIYGF